MNAQETRTVKAVDVDMLNPDVAMNTWNHTPDHMIQLTVAEEHIDVQEHVNNCVFLEWMEKVAWAHCEAAGVPYSVWQEIDYGWVAHHTEIDYRAPALLGDEILIATWIAQDNQALKLKMKRRYEIRRASDMALLVSGHTDWVCVRISTGKPARIPAEFIKAFT